MERIEGAEIVREDRGFRIGDEYHAVYFISSESTNIRFDSEGDVKITGIGVDDDSIKVTRDKISPPFANS